MTIIRFDALKAVPWKNGLGITREIAVEPPGASMEDFLWRVSIADVDTASPFSRFPGIDRTIVLLQGDGFTMTLDGDQRHALTTPCVPFSFPGEAHVEVALAGGATRDFNLMVRRGHARGSVIVANGPATLHADSTHVLIYLAEGSAFADQKPCSKGDGIIDAGTIELAPGAVALIMQIEQTGTEAL